MKNNRMGVLLTGAVVFAATIACDEEKKDEPKVEAAAQEEPATAPIPQSPPTLTVDEGGPLVRGMGVQLTQDSGAPNAPGLEKLRSYLADEKEFIEGKDLTIEIVRKAKRRYVAIFLSELHKLSPGKITIKTKTRGDLPAEIEVVPQEQATDADKCSLVGTITDDRGTAIWRLSGGQAHKRGRGMGGPDLSMTGETIETMAKKCDSPYFFVTGVEGVEWGLTYDLAAAGLSLEEAGLKKAVVPLKDLTAGNPVEL